MRENEVKERVVNFLIVLISCLAGFMISEAGYRILLHQEENTRWQRTNQVTAFSNSIWEFDVETGYKYRPNTKITGVALVDGVPKLCGYLETGNHGSPGRGIGATPIKEAKLIVVGDSFSATVQEHQTWPDILGDLLQAGSGRPAPVLNMSHDGYGVLQMFDQAAKLVREGYRPTAFVIPLIGPDLVRARFWRMTRERSGRTEVFTSSVPSLDVQPETHVRTAFIDHRVNEAWCNDGLASGKADQTGHDIEQAFDETRRADEAFFGHRVRLYSVTDCYLCNLVRYGTPLRPIAQIGTNPPHKWRSFGDDARFTSAAAVIRASGVPIWIVYLPYHPELRDGQKKLTEQEHSLLDSLKGYADQFIDLTPATPMGDAAIPLTKLPMDAHPSYAGLEYYAKALFGRLKALNLLN